ncbi:YhcH/YjgK/YiaL family protein [Candidatus Woesearchaeota archaeon]|nr:YhcH/YjgK/YiaL family protein [Candidatus Woesearchaeota archaeon]
MIIASIDYLKKKECFKKCNDSTNLVKALSFLKNNPPEKLVLGEHTIAGGMQMIVFEAEQEWEVKLKGKRARKLEAHRKYIDVHYIISGEDRCGWKETVNCIPEGEFNIKEDYVFFIDEPAIWNNISPEHVAIFFPEDAHVALCGKGKVRKVVIKVPVEEC